MMKSACSLLVLLSLCASAFSQERASVDSSMRALTQSTPFDSGVGSSVAVHKLKSPDQVLPRWAVDVSGGPAWLQQDIQLINFAQAYEPNYQPGSYYVQPKFSTGLGSAGGITASWFFNRKRNLGVALGGMYSRYNGTMTLDSFHVDYQDTDTYNTVYRQLITLTGPLREEVKISTFNTYLLLRFKHHFGKPEKPNPVGIALDAGFIVGLSNQTHATASGDFSYEAIYKMNQNNTVISGFDSSVSPNTATSLLLTEHAYNNTNPNGNAAAYFDGLRAQSGGGFNVGLHKPIAPLLRSPTKGYSSIGLGGILQASLTYELSYNMTFLASGYFLWQQWNNTGNERYRITDRVIVDSTGQVKYAVNYWPLTGAIQQSTYQAYGISAGFRFYFGEKRDMDGDGVHDAIDNCKTMYGIERFKGCPDRDSDGIPDLLDACADEPGGEETNGCPDDDHDGVPNKTDTCRYEYGELRNGCPVSTSYGPAIGELTRKADTLQEHTIVTDITQLFKEGSYTQMIFSKSDSVLQAEYGMTKSELIQQRNIIFTKVVEELQWQQKKAEIESMSGKSRALDKEEIDRLTEQRFREALEALKKR